MTKKTLAELRAETDQLMHRFLHKIMWPELEHKDLLAALAAERNAADVEIKRLTRQRDEARAEVEMLREMRELDKALEEAERLLALAKAQEDGRKACPECGREAP